MVGGTYALAVGGTAAAHGQRKGLSRLLLRTLDERHAYPLKE